MEGRGGRGFGLGIYIEACIHVYVYLKIHVEEMESSFEYSQIVFSDFFN